MMQYISYGNIWNKFAYQSQSLYLSSLTSSYEVRPGDRKDFNRKSEHGPLVELT